MYPSLQAGVPPPGHIAVFPEHCIVPVLPEDEEELEDELLDELVEPHAPLVNVFTPAA